MFVEKNPKITLKICAISKQSIWFSTTSISSSSYFSLKNSMSHFLFLLPILQNSPPFGTIPSHIIMIQTTRIQNSNQQSSLISPYPNYFIHP